MNGKFELSEQITNNILKEEQIDHAYDTVLYSFSKKVQKQILEKV